ncbi:hypothetical protein HWV62_3831 [Athelia sp. TMB]|nr:hypothetical protein HWV62_3831 [Athelia sp. TMB]
MTYFYAWRVKGVTQSNWIVGIVVSLATANLVIQTGAATATVAAVDMIVYLSVKTGSLNIRSKWKQEQNEVSATRDASINSRPNPNPLRASVVTEPYALAFPQEKPNSYPGSSQTNSASDGISDKTSSLPV